MAAAVVSFALEKIAKVLIDKAKFLGGVKGKVAGLKNELKLIQCFLRDADERGEHDQAVGEWIAQLRDISYDAEDVIERYVVRVAQKGRNIIKEYKVGKEIDGLKSSISNLRTEARDILSVKEGEPKRTRASMLKQTYAHFEENFVGREDSLKELVKGLLNDGKKHRVIFIWGMGGLGKTSLAKKAVAHEEVKNNFAGFAWACVSQEYSVKDILVRILLELIPDQRKEIGEMIDGELFKALYEIQQKKRCIVVLDDIWTKEAWDKLQAAFPVKDTKSKLLITTRNKEVAAYIDPQGLFHNPRSLLNQESWDLLKKTVFPETKAVELSSIGPKVESIAASQAVEGIARQSETEGLPVITERMKTIGDELLQKCEGLPLAVIVLGGLLAINEWETVYEKINLHFGDESGVSKVLALSYDDLPWHLKPCFLYLASFPEDAKIPARKVLHMWIAEGYVSLNAYKGGRDIQLEDVAEQYLIELVNRAMVQVQLNLSGKIKTFHLHDLMRDLCLSKATRESFLSIVDNEEEDGPSSMVESTSSTIKTRRLSLNVCMGAKAEMNGSVKRAKPIEKAMPHLRTLTFFGSIVGEWKQFQHVFIQYKFLRVLKLEDLSMLQGKLPKSVGDLVLLRFLSLLGSNFEALPQSMGKLVCMEFLDLRAVGFVIVNVPNVLWKMRRLRHLHLPFCMAVKEKFFGNRKKLRLDTLKNLRTLRNFCAKYCDVNDIGKLNNLQKLTIIGSKELEIISQVAKFTLKHLQSSSFRFFSKKSFTEDKLSEMSSYQYPCKLSIMGDIQKLPRHELLPQQLTKLVLMKSHLKEDPIPILEKLQELVVLKLGYEAFVGKEMVCSAGGFPQLKHLVLYDLPNLEEWRVDEGAMPHLSLLGIHFCPSLKEVPQGPATYHDCFDEMNDEYLKCDPSARLIYDRD